MKNADDAVVAAPPVRNEIPAEMTWDLSPLYASPEAWEADFARLDGLAAPVLALKGKIASAESLAALLDAEEALDRVLDKLETFAHLAHDTDTAEPAAQARQARISAKYAELAASCAWITPEILSHDTAELEAWRDDPVLAGHRRRLEKTLRVKPHVLSEAEETLAAQASEVLYASGETYSLLLDADLRFPDVRDGEGKAHALTEGTYHVLIESPDRELRRNAFHGLFGVYEAHQHTIASLLSTTVKSHTLSARVRRYGSAREEALWDDAVPEAVYDALIAAVRGALPDFQRYLSIRARALGVEKPDMFDLYAPPVRGGDAAVLPERAREWVLEATAPLGGEYRKMLERAFSERWIDWLENRGKRSGAYSSGCYDSAPYLLLNHQGRLDDAFTLAHELGHSMHTSLANRAQPFATAHYPIFLAEIASTFNEILLTRHLLATADDPAFRARVLQHDADAFKGTLFRQTMFAEFERDIHADDAEGIPLTADRLRERYEALNRAYYSPAVPDPDPAIGFEWARIPHFHYDFYVYKYATSFCAALIFADRILGGEPPDAYLDLLRCGGSMDPLDALARAGLDMTSPDTLAQAFRHFRELLGELEAAFAEGK
jgi:oligoendopeptidase F